MYKTFTSIRLATQFMTKASSDLRQSLQGKDWVLSPYVISSCGLPLLTCLLVTVNEASSYFESSIVRAKTMFTADFACRLPAETAVASAMEIIHRTVKLCLTSC
jgi:hypothetical protein